MRRTCLGSKQGWSRVELSNETDADSQWFSEFTLRGGEIIFSKPVCSASNVCSTTLKTVRFDFAPFSLNLSDGSNVSYDALTMSFEAPIALEQQGPGPMYVVPAGTGTHGCATVNGRSWHASAPSASPMLLRIDDDRQLLSLDVIVPLVVRADDSACSTIALKARIEAEPTLPWTLVGADGGGVDDDRAAGRDGDGGEAAP